MSTPKPNPFRAMPFPGSGTEHGYRFDGRKLKAAAASEAPEQPADEASAPTEADTGETTPPRFGRHRRTTEKE